MATDWAADVKRYIPNADDDVIAGIVRYCGIALQKRDSSLVSFTDPVETGRVRENFLKKKLGLSHPDSELDAMIADVGQQMKGDNFKNRVTVYYLLTDRLGLHHLFRKGNPAPTAASGAEAATAAGAALAGGAGLASMGGHADAGGTASTSGPARFANTTSGAGAAGRNPDTGAAYSEGKSGMSWLWWLLGFLVLLLLLWWLFFRHPAGTEQTDSTSPGAAGAPADQGVSATAAIAAPGTGPTDLAAAPAEGTVQIPTGAGVTAETRDGKPVVKVYFDTGKTDVVPAFTTAAGGLKAWLDSHSGSSLAISGYNDKTGNAAINAELSKNRAQAVQKALVAADIPETLTELVKPAETTDTSTDNAAARRVEVVVR